MAFYALVAPDITGIYNTFDELAEVIKYTPYPSFRKFYKKEEAILFIQTHRARKDFGSLNGYGNIIVPLSVTINYYIGLNYLYFNVLKENFMYLKISSSDKTVAIDNREDCIKIIQKVNLNPNKLSNHIIAIYNILQIVGPLLDINLIIPTNGIFYVLEMYKGVKPIIVRTQRLLQERLGAIGYTTEHIDKHYLQFKQENEEFSWDNRRWED